MDEGHHGQGRTNSSPAAVPGKRPASFPAPAFGKQHFFQLIHPTGFYKELIGNVVEKKNKYFLEVFSVIAFFSICKNFQIKTLTPPPFFFSS